MPEQVVADARHGRAAADATTTGWAYEIKWDGVRAIALLASPGRLRFVTRNGNDITARYPELRG